MIDLLKCSLFSSKTTEEKIKDMERYFRIFLQKSPVEDDSWGVDDFNTKTDNTLDAHYLDHVMVKCGRVIFEREMGEEQLDFPEIDL